MRQSPLRLEVLRIENPCPADWEQMTGTAQKRFCQGCQKHVHNLSAMTTDEAERLVCQSAGELCIRYAYTASGDVITVDYAEDDRREPRKRDWRFWTGIGLAGAFLCGCLQAFWPGRSSPIGGGVVAGAPPPWPTSVPTTTPTTTQPTTWPAQQGGPPGATAWYSKPW
jgi:hypothetical protein